MNITDDQAEYCREVYKKLKNFGIKVNLDLRNEKIGYKIREHTMAKVPYQIVLGDREVKDSVISVRDRSGRTTVCTVEAFQDDLLNVLKMIGE